ncbi:MAG: hypothetical protein U9O94_00190, partial [Nanoarchaeota archaeon]|nr:hypothetical protein [Nanoarchaeota archaeon]
GTVFDVLPPIITIISPENKKYGATEIQLEYIFNEDLTWCKYSLNNQANITTTETILTLTSEEGSNQVEIYCSDLSQNIGYSSVNFQVDLQSPSPVNNLAVTPIPKENSLLLSWDPNTESDLHHYNIYRSDSSFSSLLNTTLISSPTENTFKDTSLISEEAYHYAVTAVDQFSNENKNITSTNGVVADTIPPAQVKGLIISVIQDEVSLELSWQLNNETDVLYYNIYRTDQEFSGISSIQPIANSETNDFKDSNLIDGTTYHYAVTAVDDAENEIKTVVSVSRTTIDITPPDIIVSSVGSRVADNVILSATVTDNGAGLKHSCAVCISLDDSCNGGWSEENVINDFNEGNKNGTCSYPWDTTDLENTTYFYNFRISDIENNTREGIPGQTEIIPKSNLTTFNINLKQGWNLISLPLIPSDQSTSTVLSSIEGNYKKIYYYDSTTKNWEVYNPHRTIFDQPNNLLQLNVGRSYWIDISTPTTLTITGYPLTEFSLDLATDWNFIGYPYLRGRNITLALSSIKSQFLRIYSYDSEQQNWDIYKTYESVYEPNTIQEISPGVGYIIDMKSEAQWLP